MKKLGLTLAEILIVLGIAGVVASVTLPTFISNNQNKLNATKLASTLATLENAITSMMAAEGEEDFYDIEKPFTEKIHKYIKITSSGQLDDLDLESHYPELKNNGVFAKTIDNITYRTVSEFKTYLLYYFVMKNGATILQFNEVGGKTSLYIDVSKGQPNIIGRDIFVFYLNNDGKLYPYGSKFLEENLLKDKFGTFEYWSYASRKESACNNTIKGAGCTARLIENNFVVDY